VNPKSRTKLQNIWQTAQFAVYGTWMAKHGQRFDWHRCCCQFWIISGHTLSQNATLSAVVQWRTWRHPSPLRRLDDINHDDPKFSPA